MRQENGEIAFRRLETPDLALVHRWLHLPHVAKWWYADVGSYEEVSENYSAYIDGREPVEPYLILYDDEPIGYIQTYHVSDDEEYDALIGVEDSAGADLFIGEAEYLYRGLGPWIIRCFLEEVVFADRSIEVCVIGPEPENHSAIRAYEKVGFRYFKTIHAPDEPQPEYMMRLDRGDFFQDTA